MARSRDNRPGYKPKELGAGENTEDDAIVGEVVDSAPKLVTPQVVSARDAAVFYGG